MLRAKLGSIIIWTYREPLQQILIAKRPCAFLSLKNYRGTQEFLPLGAEPLHSLNSLLMEESSFVFDLRNLNNGEVGLQSEHRVSLGRLFELVLCLGETETLETHGGAEILAGQINTVVPLALSLLFLIAVIILTIENQTAFEVLLFEIDLPDSRGVPFSGNP